MDDTDRRLTLRGRLERFGDPRKSRKWTTGDVDYVAELGLTESDVPLLLSVARQWIERTDWPDDKNDVTVYAPIHAWRGLAQLGSEQAVDLLLEMMGPMDAEQDDWHLEEFPYAFAWIGPVSLPPLAAYLANGGHGVYARICAAHGLCELAVRHPQVGNDVVKALCDTLEGFETNDESLNAFLISYLLDLQEKDAAELIERAYAAGRVDIAVVGNWNHVRTELGAEGLGLVPEHLAGQKPFWSFAPPLAKMPTDFSRREDQQRKQRRAERKRQRQNRKRNRRG